MDSTSILNLDSVLAPTPEKMTQSKTTKSVFGGPVSTSSVKTVNENDLKNIAPSIRILTPKIKQVLAGLGDWKTATDDIKNALKPLTPLIGHLSFREIDDYVTNFEMFEKEKDEDWYVSGMPDHDFKNPDYVPATSRNGMMSGLIAYNIKYNS
jgi:hypothetical protein